MDELCINDSTYCRNHKQEYANLDNTYLSNRTFCFNCLVDCFDFSLYIYFPQIFFIAVPCFIYL